MSLAVGYGNVNNTELRRLMKKVLVNDEQQNTTGR